MEITKFKAMQGDRNEIDKVLVIYSNISLKTRKKFRRRKGQEKGGGGGGFTFFEYYLLIHADLIRY